MGRGVGGDRRDRSCLGFRVGMCGVRIVMGSFCSLVVSYLLCLPYLRALILATIT